MTRENASGNTDDYCNILGLEEDSPLLREDFIFGVATAAFQIEGASDVDGRVPCIWDTFCAEPGRVANGDDGSRACESYRRWEQDLGLVQDLGVDAYRFSIAWPRVITDLHGTVNQLAMDHYRRQLDFLNERGIKPFVTLYHWDLPQYLQERGGWLNRDTAYAFAHYADVVSQAFGDRVFSYGTLNEPWCSAFLGYLYGIHAPGIRDRKQAYQAAHHLLLAHGLAVPKIRVNAPAADVGIVLNISPSDPLENSLADRNACLLADMENRDLFLQPLLEGCYPEPVLNRHPESAPLVLPGDMALISAELDFLGLNYYTRNRVGAADNDAGYVTPPYDGADATDMGWEIFPQGLTRTLRHLARHPRTPALYVTENGMASADRLEVDDQGKGVVNDNARVRYLQRHLQAAEVALASGVKLRGYFAWSLLDNFEWAEGYNKRFGLYYVDYATQQRTPKASALALKALMQLRRKSLTKQ
ncbi:GH1 family beta-glucosidase [Microbulbifer sp. ALW1]|uniref:GH1 family beta-glucosidase n=1 Tax=Microbulbifer sp. (strain ALW1) TaxID=1516059 RepID=UPI001357AC71|nr:GH1 family beta-glucosidase [Microbulbifer sp. ALW1]QRV71704.1 beta-glucosidase [Microbulbifer sp. ALW1]